MISDVMPFKAVHLLVETMPSTCRIGESLVKVQSCDQELSNERDGHRVC